MAIGAFLMAIWLPLVLTLSQDQAAVSKTEKRFLEEFPSLEASWASWMSFPERTESYYDDHMGLRDDLIRGYALIDIELFGVSPTEKLVIGKQGWMFFGDLDAIANYRGVAPLTAGELETWKSVLEERQSWLADQGVEYLLVLVPDKHLMYGEFMPDNLPQASTVNPLDQLVDFLEAHSSVNLLDLRPTLETARTRERTYHRTDSHWNDFGAYAAYRSILDRLRVSSPALRDAQPAPVGKKTSTTRGLGLTSIVGLQSIYSEENIALPLTRPRARIKPEHRAGYEDRVRRLMPIAHGVEDRSLPRAVMFRDSFGNALIPYLSENFYRILYVWDRDVDPRIVLIEKPEVVIQEIVARFLGRRPIGIRERQTMPGG